MKILIADDSIVSRHLLEATLRKWGYEVVVACDGLEALEIVSQTRCDLVVTDLEMPRTNGYELLAHLLENESKRIQLA